MSPARIVSILIAAALLLLVTATAQAQSLEVKDGSPLFIEQLLIDADVEEGVAVVTIDQTFRNSTTRVTEGVYRLELPEDAVIRSLSMWMAGKEKHGQVLERRQARQVYESIVNRRLDPALLEQTGWRSFQVSVFPIPARDTVRIRMAYTYVLPDDLGLHTLSIPLPSSAGEIGALDVSAELRSSSGFTVLDCPTHTDATITGKGAGVASLSWAGERVRSPERLDVRFLPAGSGLDLRLLTQREAGKEGHFLIRVVPRLVDPPRLPRDVVFVIDTSGSMAGAKIEQARRALLHGLGTLHANDRFDILSFASGVQSLGADTLIESDAVTLESARRMVNGLSAGGGTNIEGALEAALARRTDDPGRMFMIVFLTDGDPTIGERDPNRLVAKYREGSEGKARLFAIGVGDGVKEFLLTHLAKDGRGSATYLRNDASLEVGLSALFDRVHSPVLVDPRIGIEGVETRLVEPAPLPDLFRGEALVVAGRYRGAGKANLRLRGRIGGQAVDIAIPAVFPEQPERARPHLAQLWARLRIDALLDDLRIHGPVEEIRQDVIRLGLAHQVVTPYTSFLVVEDGIRIPDPAETARVPEGPRPTTGGGGPGGPTTGGGGAGGPTTGGAGRRSTPGHGGSHLGPVGEVPPESRGPSDPPPAADPRGPMTGGGDSAGPLTGGGAGGPPAGGGAGGPVHTFGQKGSRDYSDWRFWWDIEVERVCGTRSRSRRPLSREFLDAEAFPALRALAADKGTNFLIRANAMQALARLGDTSDATRALIRAPLDDRTGTHHPIVVQRAALLPPVSGQRETAHASIWLDLVKPSHEFRIDRSFAALALAVRADADGGALTDALLSTLLSDQCRPDQRATAALALGLTGDTAALGPLLDAFEATLTGAGKTRDGDVLLVYVIDALGRLGAVSPADDLVRRTSAALRAATGKRRSTLIRRAAPRALARLVGRLPRAEREPVVEHLRAVAKNGKDASERNYALLALGRVAADARVQSKLRERALRSLRAPLTKNWWNERAFAAFALADAARGAERDAALAALREATAVADRDDLLSPLLLARAACGDDEVADQVRLLGSSNATHPWLRGDAVVAVGLLGDTANASWIRPLLDAGQDEHVRRSAARAAGLLGDAGAAGALIATLSEERFARAVERPLGRLADDAVAGGLLAIGVNERLDHSDFTAAMAIAALGRAGLTGPDRLIRVREDFHLRAHVPALRELLGVD